MFERRTIGQILMSFGRITEEDVARALAHQQEAGGVSSFERRVVRAAVPPGRSWWAPTRSGR